MPVKRRTPKRRQGTDEEEEKWLRGEPCGFIRFIEKDRLEKLWSDHRERIIAEHIADWPGTRPRRWWQYDAPEELDANETEAGFLARHRLLSAGERGRLRKGPGETVRHDRAYRRPEMSAFGGEADVTRECRHVAF